LDDQDGEGVNFSSGTSSKGRKMVVVVVVVANLVLNLLVKEIFRSISTWQSYGQETV